MMLGNPDSFFSRASMRRGRSTDSTSERLPPLDSGYSTTTPIQISLLLTNIATLDPQESSNRESFALITCKQHEKDRYFQEEHEWGRE